MSGMTCNEALTLLDSGWHDGLDAGEVRDGLAHLAACAACLTKVRSWSRVDAALDAFASACDQAHSRASICTRVTQALAQELGTTGRGTGTSEAFALERFVHRLGRDSALREQVTRIGDPAARLDRLVALGREQGFRFGSDTVRRALGTEAANDGELTDAQLEAVAGGASGESGLLQELLGGLLPRVNNR